ncbi:unnamed protein product [Cuscuta europaea]|uniref:Uncharacterized protein n=1 Tax=Cuscuta europaea TaxID=41803 RepID=A0A9P1EJS3_CUSEU|nr:unnamed protein product [Cuscuta europaea]
MIDRIDRRSRRCEKVVMGAVRNDESMYEEEREKAGKVLKQFQEDNDEFGVLRVIDVMQRMCIDHHFQHLITSILHQQYTHTLSGQSDDDDDDLYHISLRFRLLRQRGFYVPSGDVFGKFTDEKGEFKKELREDIKGVMALHEASHLCIGGEDEHILEEAARFSTECLLAKKEGDDDIRRTLEYPFHKSVPRFTAKTFVEKMRVEQEWEATLGNFASLDYAMLQSLYEDEIQQVLRWWKGLGLMDELAKNRQFKWYIWSLTINPYSHLSTERVDLTKQVSLVYLIDDIFDVYASHHQTTQFVQAICRWDLSVAEGLPDYMKTCLAVLFDTTSEISNHVFKKYGWNPSTQLKLQWKRLCRAFISEAKWLRRGDSVTIGADEYLENGIVTTGVPLIATTAFFMLGHGGAGDPTGTKAIQPILTSIAAILRLLDDLDATLGEKQHGKDASYVEYYLREHPGMSMDDGREMVTNMVSEQWKLVNRECLFSTTIPFLFRQSCLNVARMIPMMYNYDDRQCLPILRRQIMSMLSTCNENITSSALLGLLRT